MRVQDIEIHAGETDFQFAPIRRLEAKCEAATAFSSAPSMEEVNAKLREMAVGLSANAIVNVEYRSGVSFTSWRSMTGTGLAVKKISDEIICPVCAEKIKRAALKCRHCGAEVPASLHQPASNAQEAIPTNQPELQEPLRATNNPQIWIWAVGAVFLLILIASSQ